MRRTDFDVIVVGCGPSGGVAALSLARAGFNVLILEKERLPRYKPCGGGVTTKALRLLDVDVSAVIERDINSATICFRRAPRVHIDGRDIGKMVMRSAFDQLIVNEAVGAGATLLDGAPVADVTNGGTRCTVRAPHGEFHARFVIAADGINSVVATRLGLPPVQAGVAIEAEVDVDPSAASTQRVLFDFGAIPDGYAYVFPKSKHLSVGIYSTNSRVPNLQHLLREYLSSPELPPVTNVRSVVGHKVPLGRLRATVQSGRVLLVGDAAGTADPLWGEGIYYGMRSGQLAAEAVMGDAADRYTALVQRHIARDLTLARLLAKVVYAVPEAVLVGLVTEPQLAEAMMAVLRGDSNYRRYLLTLLHRAPNLVTRIIHA